MAEETYQKGLAQVDSLLQGGESGVVLPLNKVFQLIQGFIELLKDRNTFLFDLALQSTSFQTNSLLTKEQILLTMLHSLNFGMKQNNPMPRLIELGLAAYFYWFEIIDALKGETGEAVFTPEDCGKITLLSRLSSGSNILLEIKPAGFGKGKGDWSSLEKNILELKKLDPICRTVALVDLYFQLLYSESPRGIFMPHEVAKEILRHGEGVDARLMKLLIDSTGLFPVNSWVQISTQDIAQITGSNTGQPMRPIVRVMLSGGKKCDPPFEINLAENLCVQVAQVLAGPMTWEKFLQCRGEWQHELVKIPRFKYVLPDF